MNMKSDDRIKALQTKIHSWRKEKSEEELIKEEEYMLMANYLSEIERIQRTYKRKDLAKMINTSASYLTQVFRGDKPLNFYTIAKIQRALKIRFNVNAMPTNQSYVLLDAKKTEFVTTPISTVENNEGNYIYSMYAIQGGQMQAGSTKYSNQA